MSEISDIDGQLAALAAAGDDFLHRSGKLTDAWVAAGVGLEAIETILRFMEEHGALDLGSPGPLVHFVERFYGESYVAALKASVERKPTAHTAWMLNRVANHAATSDERADIIRVMDRARQNPAASAEAIAALARFADRQRALL